LENYRLLQERQPEIGGALSCQRMLTFLLQYRSHDYVIQSAVSVLKLKARLRYDYFSGLYVKYFDIKNLYQSPYLQLFVKQQISLWYVST